MHPSTTAVMPAHRLGMRKVALSRTPPPGARTPRAATSSAAPTTTSAAAYRVAAWVHSVAPPPSSAAQRVPSPVRTAEPAVPAQPRPVPPLDLSPLRNAPATTTSASIGASAPESAPASGASPPARKGTALLVPPPKVDPYGKLKYLHKTVSSSSSQRGAGAGGDSSIMLTPYAAPTTIGASPANGLSAAAHFDNGWYDLSPRRRAISGGFPTWRLDAAQKDALLSGGGSDHEVAALLPAALTPRRQARQQQHQQQERATELGNAAADTRGQREGVAGAETRAPPQAAPHTALDQAALRPLETKEGHQRREVQQEEATSRATLASSFQVGARERANWRLKFDSDAKSERQAMGAAESTFRGKIDREWYAGVRGLFTLIVAAASNAYISEHTAMLERELIALTALIDAAISTAPKPPPPPPPPPVVQEATAPPTAEEHTADSSESIVLNPGASRSSAAPSLESQQQQQQQEPQSQEPLPKSGSSATAANPAMSYEQHEERLTSQPSIAKAVKKVFGPAGGVGRDTFAHHARLLLQPLERAVSRAVFVDLVEDAVRARLQPEQL